MKRFSRPYVAPLAVVGTFEAQAYELNAQCNLPLPLPEIGRKGGNRKTEAQRAALSKGSRAGNAVKSAQAIGRRAQIQALKEAGYKQREVAEKMGLSLRTVKGYWR